MTIKEIIISKPDLYELLNIQVIKEPIAYLPIRSINYSNGLHLTKSAIAARIYA